MQAQDRDSANKVFWEDMIDSTKVKKTFLPFHPSLGCIAKINQGTEDTGYIIVTGSHLSVSLYR